MRNLDTIPHEPPGGLEAKDYDVVLRGSEDLQSLSHFLIEYFIWWGRGEDPSDMETLKKMLERFVQGLEAWDKPPKWRFTILNSEKKALSMALNRYLASVRESDTRGNLSPRERLKIKSLRSIRDVIGEQKDDAKAKFR